MWWTVSSVCRRALLVLGSAGADCCRIVTCSGWNVAELAEGVCKLAAQPLVLFGEFAVAAQRDV